MLPKRMPHWIIIPIGFALALASIVIGLVLEPAVQSLAQHPDPTPTLPCLNYAAPLSADCVGCHTDQARVDDLAASDAEAERLFIQPTQVDSIHGRLGCVTCHAGTPNTDDPTSAHDELVSDPSTRFEETCLLCHRDLRHEASRELLHEPHGSVLDRSSPVDCSACHGAVGHGFVAETGEVICSMGACLECHEERELDVQSRDCGSCHVGPHDVPLDLSCSDCHASIQTWSEVSLSVHPIELTGQHAEARCVACHDWPSFGGVSHVCSDCHDRPHEFGDDNCAGCHTPDGWSAGTLEGHDFPTDHGGQETECSTCHIGGDTSSYYCFTCHSAEATVDRHQEAEIADVLGKCTSCHPEGE